MLLLNGGSTPPPPTHLRFSMKLKLNLGWKIVVGAPKTGFDYYSTNKHFNFKTGKSFLKKIGGISSLAYYPFTFDPTHIFYNAIEPFKLENGFSGKRIPFEGTIEDTYVFQKNIRIKINRFSSDFIILSVSVDEIDFDEELDNLQKIVKIETHTELYNLVRSICSIISSGGEQVDPIHNKPKIYPFIQLESTNHANPIDNKLAVELLTRHQNPKPEIIDDVISKNHDHQVDKNSILLDRQGILARYDFDTNENKLIKRKFESSHHLFELAISLAHTIEKNRLGTLNTEQEESIYKLIKKPEIIFTKSVTAYKTWELLLNEFKLTLLYDHL